MDIRQLADGVFTAPHPDPSDFPEMAAAGIRTIICNRPDGEVPPQLQHEEMAAAAQSAGLEFHYHPMTGQSLTPEAAQHQRDLIDRSTGPVVGYCTSGTRTAILWALGQAGDVSATTLLESAAAAGYDLSMIKSYLEATEAKTGG